jgi:ferredoxin-NADP reductase
MVTGRFAGRRPRPFSSRTLAVVARADDSAERRTALLSPRTVKVARVIRETPDAVTLVLEDATGAPFRFMPGQFFTLVVPVAGELLRRAYSACNDARETERVAITVKRVANGVVSNHVNDHVREGDLLQLLGPSGSFVAEPRTELERHLVLIAGGSGITPMMSIARTVLAADPRARITLVYGNRGEGDVIFKSALEETARAYGARFVVRHVLSAPPVAWTGGVGMLEERVVREELDACGLDERASFFLCGPEPMMRASRAALLARGVPEARILEERFSMPHLRPRPSNAISSAGPQLLTIRANGAGVREVYVAPEQTMLEAGLSAGVKMDYSCTMGGCAACKVRLCDGDIEMEEPNCLSASEREQGYVLACVARVRSASTIALATDPAFAPAQAARGAR